MELIEAIKQRHSVRSFLDQAIDEQVKQDLGSFIEQCNQESGLNIQMVIDEPKAFNSFMAHYGKFKNVTNYIILAGKKSSRLEETCGYYGEKIVLKATQLGLNTCWVAQTYKKKQAAYQLDDDVCLCCVIAIGYGINNGVKHKSKTIDQVSVVKGEMPPWFVSGVQAALLAPTALNQQKFKFVLEANKVSAKAGMGFYTKIDLGIIKYHFEIGAGIENFIWC